MIRKLGVDERLNNVYEVSDDLNKFLIKRLINDKTVNQTLIDDLWSYSMALEDSLKCLELEYKEDKENGTST